MGQWGHYESFNEARESVKRNIKRKIVEIAQEEVDYKKKVIEKMDEDHPARARDILAFMYAKYDPSAVRSCDICGQGGFTRDHMRIVARNQKPCLMCSNCAREGSGISIGEHQLAVAFDGTSSANSFVEKFLS